MTPVTVGQASRIGGRALNLHSFLNCPRPHSNYPSNVPKLETRLKRERLSAALSRGVTPADVSSLLVYLEAGAYTRLLFSST